MPAAYTPEQKAQALALYMEHGTAEASRQTGITGRTITRWASAAGLISADNTEKLRQANTVGAERIQAAWTDYREQEALAAGAAAARLRNLLLDAAEEGNHQLLRALAISYGISIDKAELLSGRATQRIEQWSESALDAELRKLVDEVSKQ